MLFYNKKSENNNKVLRVKFIKCVLIITNNFYLPKNKQQ